MWGSLSGLAYHDQYYAFCATSDHPCSPSTSNCNGSLIAQANGPPYTARDANCHLLWAANGGASDPQLGVPADAGFAFREHSAVAAGGVQSGAPFTVYWFDDNTLALSMSVAYGRSTASGLVPVPDFNRWAVVSGNALAWHGQPYGAPGNSTSDSYVDTHALNGLYDLAKGDFPGALDEWKALLAMTGSTYDGATQRYVYPAIDSNYYIGLFKMLTEELRANPAAATSNPDASALLQHSMALDSNILDNQQQQGSSGTLIGWVTAIPPGGSLINTETIACEVLGLGAAANTVLEPGVAPLSSDANGYYPRPYHALSAVVLAMGGSQPGYMTLGPGFQAPPGTYQVDFRLRAPAPADGLATVSVKDDVSGSTLVSHDVAGSELATGNMWSEITVTVPVTAPCNQLDLRVYWHGGSNLDVGPIRVR
jgi:hypothetical protein